MKTVLRWLTLIGVGVLSVLFLVRVFGPASGFRATPVQTGTTTAAANQPRPTVADQTAANASADPATAATDAVGQFRDWFLNYQLASDAATRARLEAEGEALARQRREVMARLIEVDPQGALAAAIPYAQRQQLPAAIAQFLEQPVSGRGTLAVVGVLPDPELEGSAAGIDRRVEIGDQAYRAFVYGRRLEQTTKQNIPLHGIAIGDALAVHENSVRVLDPAEASARAVEVSPEDAKCPVSGNDVSVEDAAAVVDVGGRIRILCNGGHIEVLEGEWQAAESPAPTEAALNAWSQGPKTLLYIRVRFSDQTADPQTLADSQTMLANVDKFFIENSYDTTTISSTITPVYTLTNTTAWYASNGIYVLRSDALNAAKAGGYDYVNWNLDAVRYVGGPGSFSGAAYVGARGCWMKSSSAGVAAHEFGHNYGAWHANSWNPTDDSPIGPGTWQEYGDSFDTMGSAGAGVYHFNARYKNVLNWIPPEGWQTASGSGTYRIYAHDFINSSNAIRGLRVPKNSSKNYWVEFRQKWTGNTWLMNGAGLRRADNSNNNNPGSELLDTTPGSPDSKTDSGLLIGRTFSDSSAGVHITPIAKGGTVPESLDVTVNLGTFPGNGAPSLTINASSTAVAVGAPVTFTASASDPNGDALAYSWDFNDKTYGLNSASASKSWSAAGEYVVTCVASDMKGGTATRWVVVTVGSPATYRISGRVTDSGGVPMEGVRVHNGKTSTAYRGCFTDVDGNYTLAGLVAGSYTVGGAFIGQSFAPSGFANPVVVGPSKTAINFVGSPKTYRITGRVTDGGLGLADVLVSDGTRTALSNPNGDYVINNVPNGSYTVTASKPGHAFNVSGWANPVVIEYADAINRSFVTPTYTISGEITGPAVTTVVTVTDGYRTTSSFRSGSGTSTKNLFNLSGVPAGSWTLRALLPGASFSPVGFSNPLTVTGSTSAKNFALDAVPTYAVGGTITFNGVGLKNVSVTAGTRGSLSDSRGGYFVQGLANGTYDVVPSLAGYGFSPAAASITIADTNVSGQNFSASQVVTATVTLTAPDAAAAEPGSDTGQFTVTRTGSTFAGLVVYYSIAGTATAGADYAALSGSVTIPSGASSATITVTPTEDSVAECPETVVATLATDIGYTIGFPNSGTVTIADNDLPAVSIIALGATVWENGGSNTTLQVTRNGCLGNALTVSYGVGGTASAGTDYQTLAGSVTLAAGSATALIPLTPLDDLVQDGDKTVLVTLIAAAGYAVGGPAGASVNIVDNETNHGPLVNAGLDQTNSILGLASLSGTVTDDGLPGVGLTYSWSKISGPGSVVAGTPTAKDTVACFSMTGTYVLRLTGSDGLISATDDVTVTVIAANPAMVLNAINAGGPAYTDTQGLGYRADTWFTGGATASSSANIAATADASLYQTERSGDFAYNVPVSGGTHDYLLVLKFADPTATGAGQRVFGVSVNGSLLVDNLDLYAVAGANTALDLVLPVTATTDSLNVQFQTQAGSTQPAKVNAILVGATQVLSPAAPASLTATAASASQINLSWADRSANESSFQLEVSTNGATYTALPALGANVTTYVHSGLSPSTTYSYRLRACNTTGCSAPATASAATQAGPPAAPSNLTLAAASTTQIDLTWTDNSPNEDGFAIERSPTGTATTYIQIGSVPANQRTYSSTGLSANTRYYFRVRAFNSAGNSAYSNSANTKTKSR